MLDDMDWEEPQTRNETITIWLKGALKTILALQKLNHFINVLLILEMK